MINDQTQYYIVYKIHRTHSYKINRLPTSRLRMNSPKNKFTKVNHNNIASNTAI